VHIPCSLRGPHCQPHLLSNDANQATIRHVCVCVCTHHHSEDAGLGGRVQRHVVSRVLRHSSLQGRQAAGQRLAALQRPRASRSALPRCHHVKHVVLEAMMGWETNTGDIHKQRSAAVVSAQEAHKDKSGTGNGGEAGDGRGPQTRHTLSLRPLGSHMRARCNVKWKRACKSVPR
jgi:hypothetical protein